jgi:hypothetical protein
VGVRFALPPALVCASVLLLVGCGGGRGDGGPDRTDGASNDQAPAVGVGGDEQEAATDLGFPSFATRNTTRVGGADGVAVAAGVALGVFPSRADDSRPKAVTLVDTADWRVAVSAAQLMAPPLRAPLLYSDGGGVPAATEQALAQLSPSGAKEAGGAQVLRVGKAAEPQGYKATNVEGADYAALAQAIDRLQV